MKFLSQLVCSSLAVLMVSGCSNGPMQRRMADGDFEYLNAKMSAPWKAPKDADLQYYHDYEIPDGNYQGNVGDQIDIRPPQSVLALIPGVQIDSDKNGIVFWTVKSQLADEIWHVIVKFLEQNQVNTTKKTDSLIDTGWVSWIAEDEVEPVKARYRYSRIQKDDRYGLQVSLLTLQNGDTQEDQSEQQDRYTVMMANAITTRYDTQAQEDASRQSRLLARQIAVSMGTDRSGLPVVIARTPYENMWQRLSHSLDQIGFKIEDKNKSQGSLKIKFSQPDETVWQSLGVTPLSIKSETYTLLLGDLGNRTSINLTDDKGKPVTEDKLKEFSVVLSALFK